MNFYTKALIAIAFVHEAQAVKCTALAMSGGANYGAWEIGVVYGLAHYGNPEDYYYDVVSGISAGAINAAGMAGWAPEEVVEMTEYLSDAWFDITTPDIWLKRPDEKKAVLNEKSLLDDSPALLTILDIMSIKSEYAKRVSVAAVDINNGEYVEFNQNNTDYFEFYRASMASGSIPVVFPPQHF